MRILFTSHYALPHVGGVELVIDVLARRLMERGHSVTYVAADTGAGLDEPYRVIRIPAWNGIERRLGIPYPVYSPTLLGTLREEISRADVVHAHGMLYGTSVVALLMARMQKHACRVLTEHVGHVPYSNVVTNAVEALAITSIGRIAARSAQAIVVLNDVVEAQMHDLAPSVPTVRIGNGVDSDRYRPPEPVERVRLRRELGWDERPRVLFVGRLVEKKGVSLAIEAAARAEGEFDVVLVGPGDLDLAGARHVQLLGPQTPARVAELYRAADVFLLPSRGEGFPLTVQEAMASGLPVVLADDPAYSSVLKGCGAGVTLVAREADAIGNSVRQLISFGLARAGREGREFALRIFDWSATVDRHVQLYERLLSGASVQGR
jgi:D-inositol-3-phosphate glycosyltransferase